MYTIPNQPFVRRGDPLNKGLVGCWLMQEPNGPDTRDISGLRNHATLVNGPTRVMSPYGPVLRFPDDSTFRYAAATLPPCMTTGPFSVSMWLCLTTRLLNSVFSLRPDNESPGFFLQRGSGNALWSPGSGYRRWTTLGIDGIAWHHTVLIVTGFDASDINDSQLWLNGLSCTVLTTAEGTSSARSVFRLGSDGSARLFAGDIGPVAIYDRVLAPAEIRRLAGLDGDPWLQWRSMPKRRDDDFYGPPINNDIGDSAFLGSVV